MSPINPIVPIVELFELKQAPVDKVARLGPRILTGEV
jgi:hypothetical protein